MTVPLKNWEDLPTKNTPIDRESLRDLEERLGAYTDKTSLTVLKPSGGDDSAALQALISADCDILLGPGTFLWNTEVVKLPRSATGIRIRGSGVGVTTIKLSATVPRAFDFNKIANQDTFQNIELSDFTVDANNIEGFHHVVIGTYVNKVFATDLNFDRLSFRRIRTINVYDNAANITNAFRANLFISTEWDAGTQTLTNILCEDLDFMGGGDIGVEVAARGAVAANVKVSYDNISFIRCRCARKNVPTTTFSSAGFQIGAHASGGSCKIIDCFSQNSADVSIEIDNVGRADIRNFHSVDAYNGFTTWNFRKPTSAQGGHVTIRGLMTEVNSLAEVPPGYGVDLGEFTAAPLASLSITDWKHRDNTAAGRHVAFRCLERDIERLTLERVQVLAPAVANTAKGNLEVQPIQLSLAPGGAGCHVTLRDIGFKYAGTCERNSFVEFWPIAINTGTFKSLLIDGVTFDIALTEMENETLRGIVIGLEATTLTSGSIRNLRYTTYSKDAAPRCVTVYGTATLTITDRLTIENCDFSAMAAGGDEIHFEGTSNAAKVFSRGNVYKNLKAPTELTLAGSGTGTLLKTVYPVTIQLVPGTGTEVTKVEYSTDGGAHYTEILPTQVKGKVPAAPTLLTAGPLPTNTYIQAVYAGGTQPTIKLVPVDP